MVTHEDIAAFRCKLKNDLAGPICFYTGQPWATQSFIISYIDQLSDERIAKHLVHQKKFKSFGNFPDLDYKEIITKHLITKDDVSEYKTRLAEEMRKVVWDEDEEVPQTRIAGHHYHKKGERVYDEEQIKQECSTVSKFTLLGGDLFGNTPEEHAHSDYVCY